MMKKKYDYHTEDFYKTLDERYAEYKRTGISVREKEVNRSSKNLLATKKKEKRKS